VFYVDGSPVVSDVQLWGDGSSTTCQAGSPNSDDIDASGHVCGWGTVMVVPFRLGGGPIQVDTVGKGNSTDTESSNSAYVILDVTDPEIKPTVLGEITTGSYTTSEPAFSVHRESSDGKLHFLLTIGSGPADNGGPESATDTTDSKPVSAAANSSLGVWVYDLANVKAQSNAPVASFTGATGGGPSNSFAGDMVASDFDLNDSAEGVYFGVVTNPPPASKTQTPVPQVYGGGLWKLDMNTGPTKLSDGTSSPADTSNPSTWKLVEVIDAGQPVTIRPTVALDSSSRPMVYFGTGRSFTLNDDSGTSDQGVQQQYIYGVADNSLLTNMAKACQAMPTVDSLYDAGDASVAANGTVSGSGLTDVSTLSGLESALLATSDSGSDTDGCYQYSGWRLALNKGNSDASKQQPSERVVSSQTLFNGILLTPTYTPANLQEKTDAKSSDCNPIPVPGTSNLYGLDYLTGTAATSLASVFGTDSSGHVSKSVSLGSGKASSPVLHTGNGILISAFGISGGTVYQGGGALGNADNGEISWREPLGDQ
jgi:type IV pilus assembly protein PilY1